MRTTFPTSFSFIDFYRLYDKTDNSTILAIIFKDLEEAVNWEWLLISEPYSFIYQVIENAPSKFIFKFTNCEFDYIFPVPQHVDESLLNFHLPYHAVVYLVDSEGSLKPFGKFHKMSPIPLN